VPSAAWLNVDFMEDEKQDMMVPADQRIDG
jgi:hypothetical protein